MILHYSHYFSYTNMAILVIKSLRVPLYKLIWFLLQGALTQLIQYYHRFHKVLSQKPFANLPIRSELINIHNVMVEVKKHKPNFQKLSWVVISNVLILHMKISNQSSFSTRWDCLIYVSRGKISPMMHCASIFLIALLNFLKQTGYKWIPNY